MSGFGVALNLRKDQCAGVVTLVSRDFLGGGRNSIQCVYKISVMSVNSHFRLNQVSERKLHKHVPRVGPGISEMATVAFWSRQCAGIRKTRYQCFSSSYVSKSVAYARPLSMDTADHPAVPDIRWKTFVSKLLTESNIHQMTAVVVWWCAGIHTGTAFYRSAVACSSQFQSYRYTLLPFRKVITGL